MISIDQLLTLARAYSEATGIALTGVGQRSCGNNRLFQRLAEGKGANILSMNRAAEWFVQNWPDGTEWPDGVPGNPRTPADSSGNSAPSAIRKPRSKQSAPAGAGREPLCHQ